MVRKYIFINLAKNTVNFCDMEFLKKDDGYSVIMRNGKLGNKGTTIILCETTAYQDAKKIYWQKCAKKEADGFKLFDSVVLKINEIFDVKTTNCDSCGAYIKPELYVKIDNFLRSEYAKADDYKNEVFCFQCQKKKGLYVKK